MSFMQSVTNEALSKLQRVLEENESVDWRAISFAEPSSFQTLRWQGLEGTQDELLPLLKAYQRLLHILPVREEHRALPLLQIGLHSAIQIANMPSAEFARRWAMQFPGEEALGELVHQNAVSRRSYILLKHINAVQCSEPHYRAARFQ